MFSSLQQKLNASPLFGQPQVMTGNIISWSEYNKAVRAKRYVNEEDSCDPTMRVTGSDRVKIDLGMPTLAVDLDEFLGNEMWTEVSRQASQFVVNGVSIYRIDQVTFQRPSGPNTTLVFNHPPIEEGGIS